MKLHDNTYTVLFYTAPQALSRWLWTLIQAWFLTPHIDAFYPSVWSFTHMWHQNAFSAWIDVTLFWVSWFEMRLSVFGGLEHSHIDSVIKDRVTESCNISYVLFLVIATECVLKWCIFPAHMYTWYKINWWSHNGEDVSETTTLLYLIRYVISRKWYKGVFSFITTAIKLY